jgi:hypothetical protein
MTRQATYAEQWEDRLGADTRRFRVRVRPSSSGTWQLQPRNYEFDPCLVYWAMCPMPDGRFKEGVSYRTVWLAFHEPPDQQIEREYHDGEAIVVNDEPVLNGVIVPGFRFVGTVDGKTSVVEVEVLE